MMKYNEKLSKDSRITILSLSWRDIKSPTAGGAEVHTHEMLSRADSQKYRMIHIAPYYDGLKEAECIDNINYIRRGNIFTVIWYAFCYYKKNNKCIDYVIDQCNTHRFFSPLWVRKEKRIFFILQLTREIWDINLYFPFNKIGKIVENFLLRLNRNDHTITESCSTKNDLIAVGFDPEKIVIIPVGMNFMPWKIEDFATKEKDPTFVYVGRYAKYKGINIAVKAFGKIKEKYPTAKLWILGKEDERYILECLIPICKRYGLSWGKNDKKADVVSWGFVSEKKKLNLLSKATVLLFPSIREGWGIPITEAANVGTPSIVYDSPGIRDAVDFGRAGYLCEKNTLAGLVKQMLLVLKDEHLYQKKRMEAYEFSKQFLWENTRDLFDEFISSVNTIG